HHGRRRHIAVIAQDTPCVHESTLPETEGALERRDHLGAAGMADKTVDVTEPKPVPTEKVRRDVTQLRRDKLRNVARKDRAEPVIGDPPAHDVETVGPRVLARSDDGRALAIARKQCTGSTVAEKRRSHDVTL